MDQTSKEKLEGILRTSPGALTEGDKDFLRARESYLTDDQKRIYAEVFEVPEESTGGLQDKKVIELQELATSLGIETDGLKKADLIAAIEEKQA